MPPSGAGTANRSSMTRSGPTTPGTISISTNVSLGVPQWAPPSMRSQDRPKLRTVWLPLQAVYLPELSHPTTHRDTITPTLKPTEGLHLGRRPVRAPGSHSGRPRSACRLVAPASLDGLPAIPHMTAHPMAGWPVALVPPAVQSLNRNAQHFRDICQRHQLLAGLQSRQPCGPILRPTCV
jgi:hypothetical protein